MTDGSPQNRSALGRRLSMRDTAVLALIPVLFAAVYLGNCLHYGAPIF